MPLAIGSDRARCCGGALVVGWHRISRVCRRTCRMTLRALAELCRTPKTLHRPVDDPQHEERDRDAARERYRKESKAAAKSKQRQEPGGDRGMKQIQWIGQLAG